ncbi:MAG: hypothetical protein US67_C0077G0005 [Candidatus Woesebacteria bacterium GW2011_GWD1_38_10]|uniref:HdeD family acid-resistance protein n=1 Tax=Candidatus Woesebacteria bacterium GW2011_GWD1_38_10 TaxID=1618592 RepID=A0A0G0KBQ4_9BACT|nr:MAG: hypothetical protein US67_C0077G0005 [Candidatus Woesebacteria bacterium GW2011_GWD1_38_10]HAP37955.1 hypothetical protein [Candidatus Shapirobacteria bacterium]HBP51375.1 hypothetical protein [Candidatus Shapirobacteria bacterium]
MKGFIHDIWWMLLLRGITLLLFGIAAVVWPGMTFVSLAVLFATYILVSGVMNILMSIGAITEKRAWFLTFILGIAEIAIGVYLLKNPVLTMATFVATVGITYMIEGIFAIISAFADTFDPGMRLLEVASGILGIVAGYVVLRYPVSGGLTFTWILGVHGLIVGTICIASALSLHNFEKEVTGKASTTRA